MLPAFLEQQPFHQEPSALLLLLPPLQQPQPQQLPQQQHLPQPAPLLYDQPLPVRRQLVLPLYDQLLLVQQPLVLLQFYLSLLERLLQPQQLRQQLALEPV